MHSRKPARDYRRLGGRGTPIAETLTISTEFVEDVDDPLLTELDEIARAEESLLGPMGDAAEEPALDVDRPYDLELVKPRAVDLRKLCKLAGKDLPQEMESSLGLRVPVLLYHGLTPFARPGERPRGVWGLGYEVRPVDVDAATVALSPDTESTKIGEINSEVRIGLSAGGEMSVPAPVLEAANAIPGISLQGAKLEATTDQTFALAIRVEFSMVKVEAGAIGAGGARWNVYRAGQRVVGFQPFIQTVLLPKKTRTLQLAVQPWVARRGWLFGKLGSRKFIPAPTTFDVSLEGLGR
jgi:hypothetical protein